MPTIDLVAISFDSFLSANLKSPSNQVDMYDLYYYRQTLQTVSMQQPTSEITISQPKNNPKSDVKSQIESIYNNQTNLLTFFQQKDQQLQQMNSKLKQTVKLTSKQSQKLKQLLTSFAEECKNEWTMIWKQFFSLFQRIIYLYQIKIEKLQGTIAEQDVCIQTLKKPESNVISRQYGLFDSQQHKQTENSIVKKEESDNFSEKLQKRVKISDVIAQYNQNNSMSSNLINSFAQAVTEQNDQSQPDESGAPKVLMEIAQRLNRQSLNYKISTQSYRNHSERLADNHCEMSAILSAESSQRTSPMRQIKAKKHSMRTNKQNSLNYSKKMKQSQQSKKKTNYFTKNAKPYESQVLGPTCKLDELRKNLLQRKKSEHLL